MIEKESNDLYVTLVSELIEEKHINSANTKPFIAKIKAAIQDLEDNIVASTINFEKDLKARNLVKEYVFYDYYNMLPEFKERYANELTKLQFQYNSTLL